MSTWKERYFLVSRPWKQVNSWILESLIAIVALVRTYIMIILCRSLLSRYLPYEDTAYDTQGIGSSYAA